MTAELRARVEELQGGIKQAKALLEEPPPDTELAAATAAADAEERDAAGIEKVAAAARTSTAKLRDEVEREEQRLLAAEASGNVPAVAVLVTLAAQFGACWALIALHAMPRTGLLVPAAQAMAVGAALAVAWITKRRFMQPSSGVRVKVKWHGDGESLD